MDGTDPAEQYVGRCYSAVRTGSGVELSQLYFVLSYPAAESRFGNMVTLLAPAEGRKYDLSKSMIGNASGTYLKSDGLLKVRNGKYYQTATTETDRYFGLSSPLDARLCSGRQPMVLTLLPEDSYHQASLRSRQIWYAGTFVFLILILLMEGCATDKDGRRWPECQNPFRHLRD